MSNSESITVKKCDLIQQFIRLFRNPCPPLSKNDQLRLNSLKIQHNTDKLDSANFVGQDKQLIERFQQNTHLSLEISKAQMVGSFIHIVLAIAQHLLNGSYKQRQIQLDKFLVHYFQSKAKINLQNGYFCPRIERGLQVDPIHIYQGKYLIHGVDLITTRMISYIYNSHHPHIQWIDSSHCLLAFKDFDKGRQFIRQNLTNNNQLEPWRFSNKILAKDWVQLNSYCELFYIRRLYARNFTKADEIFLQSKERVSEQSFKNYYNCKNQLQESLKADPKIEAILKRIEVQQTAIKVKSRKYKDKQRLKKTQRKRNYRKMQENDKYVFVHLPRSLTKDHQKSSQSIRESYSHQHKNRLKMHENLPKIDPSQYIQENIPKTFVNLKYPKYVPPSNMDKIKTMLQSKINSLPKKHSDRPVEPGFQRNKFRRESPKINRRYANRQASCRYESQQHDNRDDVRNEFSFSSIANNSFHQINLTDVPIEDSQQLNIHNHLNSSLHQNSSSHYISRNHLKQNPSPIKSNYVSRQTIKKDLPNKPYLCHYEDVQYVDWSYLDEDEMYLGL